MLHFAKARRQSTGGGNANALNRYPPISVPWWLYIVRDTISQKLGIILEILVHVVSLFLLIPLSFLFFFFFFFLSFFLTIISVLSVPSSFVELRSVACNKKLLEGKNFPVKKTP